MPKVSDEAESVLLEQPVSARRATIVAVARVRVSFIAAYLFHV